MAGLGARYNEGHDTWLCATNATARARAILCPSDEEAFVFDLVIRGGRVHDGLGGAPRDADVAVEDGRVAAIGRDLGSGRRHVDVDGLVVAPGFVDAHAHSDLFPLFDEPVPFKLAQGVTTEVVGNCGISYAPLDEAGVAYADEAWGELVAEAPVQPGTFDDFLRRIEAAGPTNHMAALVGHHALRIRANGLDDALRDGALEHMRELADEAFAAGAIGLSTGLIYVPGTYADTDEVVELATVAGRWGRVYATHMRDEGDHLEDALDEAIAIGRRAGVRVQVSHCKAAGTANHGKAKVLLSRLHEARRSGVDVRGDQYPYTSGSTILAALLPTGMVAGGIDQLRSRLADPEARAEGRGMIGTDRDSALWSDDVPELTTLIAHRDTEVIGRTLAEVAGDRDVFDVLCDLVAADPGSEVVIRLMAEDDVRTIMADPLVAVGSDNGPPVGMQHPRTWGCYPRFFGDYVRDQAVVPLPEAVRKATSAVATQFGLVGRGVLAPGAVADVTVFDPDTIGHGGTYDEPSAAPTGIPWVVLAGEVVVDEGRFTGVRAGQVIRGGR